MVAESNKKVRSYCVGFSEGDFDEREPARRVAEHLGTEHQEDIVKVDAINILPILQRHYGEPFGDPSTISTYYLCKFTGYDLTVAISGDGGDELFAGYNTYRRLRIRQLLKLVTQSKSISHFLHYFANYGQRRLTSRSWRAWNTLVESSLPLEEQFCLLRCMFNFKERQSLYTDQAILPLNDKQPAMAKIKKLFSEQKMCHRLRQQH